jgi:hypothetical protein
MRKRIRKFLEHVEDTLLEELEDVYYDIKLHEVEYGYEAESLFVVQQLKIGKQLVLCKLSLVQSILNWI